MDQRIKNYLGYAAIFGIIVLAVIGWRYVGAYADSQPGNYRSFSVSADGTSNVIPDVAKFTYKVVTEGGKDLSSLQADNTKKGDKAIAFLKGQGIEAKDIKTSDYSVDPRYEYSNCGVYGTSSCPPPTIVGYTVSQTVAVTVRDIAKASDALSGVVANGANTVSQLQFTLDDSDSAKADARAEAFKKAEDKAKQIAKEGGFSLGRLLSVQVSDSGENRPVYYDAMGLGGAGSVTKSAPAPTLEPGSKEVKVSVYLSYEID